jgi:PAS domain S-box-containing protein
MNDKARPWFHSGAKASNMTCKKESGNEVLEKTTDVEVLRESVIRLKLLSDAAFEAIFLSEKGICIDQNQTAEKLFGYSLQEAVGRHGSEWIIPEDREVVKSKMLLEEPSSYEVTALRKDGTTFPCEIQARNLRFNDRNLRVTSLRDISERWRAEKMRENLQAQLANSIEMAHLGPWEYDAVKDIFIFNDYFYRMFRTTAAEVGGYTMTSAQYAQRFLHPSDRALVRYEVRKALETDDPQYSRQLEHRILYADGTEGYITVRFFIQKDANGKTVRTYGFNQDTTSRKLSEEALRLLNEQLAQRTELAEVRARQLQLLTMELIESEEVERRRLAELLHDDLQQLLSAALLQLEAGSQSQPPSPELDFAHHLLKESIARTRSLAHELTPVILYHSGLVTGLERMVKQMEKNYDLTVLLEVELPPVTDLAKVQVFVYRAVQELLFNAVKHSMAKSACVKLAVAGEDLKITVSDQGRGFNPDELKSVGKKPGLGLMTLRERTNYFGGSLEIDASPGRGSKIILRLPLDRA